MVFPAPGDSSSMDASALVFAVHGALLRHLAAASGVHYQGLQQAARHLRTAVPPQLVRRLMHLDAAYNVVRHITGPSCQALLAEVVAHLPAGSADLGGTTPGVATAAPTPLEAAAAVDLGSTTSSTVPNLATPVPIPMVLSDIGVPTAVPNHFPARADGLGGSVADTADVEMEIATVDRDAHPADAAAGDRSAGPPCPAVTRLAAATADLTGGGLAGATPTLSSDYLAYSAGQMNMRDFTVYLDKCIVTANAMYAAVAAQNDPIVLRLYYARLGSAAPMATTDNARLADFSMAGATAAPSG